MQFVFLILAQIFCTPVEKTMLCLGDSYTIGQSVHSWERFPEQTVQLLNENGHSFASPHIIAQTGYTCKDLSVAIQKSNTAANYDIVTLLIGVNDQFRGYDTSLYTIQFEQLLQTAIHFAKNMPQHVFVLSIPDYGVTPFATNLDNSPDKIAKEIDSYNRMNKRIANNLKVHYIDITDISRKAKSDATLLASDGLHPSGKMYQQWAELLANDILNVYEK